MLQRSDPQVRRYSAFLSYSRTDVHFARHLQRRLEGYRLPSNVKDAAGSVDGRRLRPIFRDDDELVAAHDLTQAVREALAQSDHLIVVCSPRAAQSAWVAHEIELFRRLHGAEKVLAALLEGEPDEAFPAALRRRPHGRATDPLAADFRRGAGSERMALLKLVAPLAGVGLDELIHRDAQRKLRQTAVVSAGAVAAVAIVGVSAVLVVTERAAAERERVKGHALVQSVINVRKGLKSAGRLDIQSGLTRDAMEAYRRQDLSQLPDSDLQEWAQLLQGAGEDQEKKGDLTGARADFIEARRTTAALLASKPNDPKRIFDHAQSEYWVGFINWRTGDGAAARDGFERYARLVDRLIAQDRKNPDWLMEAGYAQSNLGLLALRQAGDARTAQTHFAAALAWMQAAVERKPDLETQRQVADGYGWLADSLRVQGDFAGAQANREAERAILLRLRAQDPRDAQVGRELLFNRLAFARIDAERGAVRSALAKLEQGRSEALSLARQDPLDTRLSKQARMFELFEVRTWLGAPGAGRPNETSLLRSLRGCAPEANLADPEITAFCTALEARVLAAAGDTKGARHALDSLRLPPGSNTYSAKWGVNFPSEIALIRISNQNGGSR